MTHKERSEAFLQEVGASIQAHPAYASKAMLYAEVEDGVISADLFFQSPDRLCFKFAPPELRELVYAYWEHSRLEHEWRVLSYVLENGRLAVDLSYPNDLNPNDDLSDRRPIAVGRAFPGLSIDYSNPKGL